MKLLPVILAGGGGTRLWPLSREHFPKQFLTVTGDKSLLQETLLRLDGLSSVGETMVLPPLIVCNEEHRFLVAEQTRALGRSVDAILLEPVGRNTAPALTVAALRAMRGGEDPILLMMPADHVIEDLSAFRSAVMAGLEIAKEGALLTFGIVADRPETGYGYIKRNTAGAANTGNAAVHPLLSFVEKPDVARANEYVASGEYAWNSGVFMMKASVWLSALASLRPEIHSACEAAVVNGVEDKDFFRLGRGQFEACPSDSIDYAVMERIAGDERYTTAVITLDAGWSDVGSWSSLWDLSAQDETGNVVSGDVKLVDSTNTLVFAEHRLVVSLGCEDLIIVETPDAVMVATQDKAQDVKRIVEWLKEQGREERLTHRRVYRPWGSYEGVDAGPRFQVKKIIVNPGASLSLQMHHHRAEHWIVVNGTAKVTKGDEEFLLCENQSTYIPLGVTHRLANPGTIPLELIEVQSGSYLGEDDIVRFEDIYNRHTKA